MHLVFRERHGLEETDTPESLGQTPGDLVVLSFSDAELGAFAAGWERARAGDAAFPSLRLANLARLRHPLSVDDYVENTLHGARAVLVRLIGGARAWDYGLARLEELARDSGLVIAALGVGQGDGPDWVEPSNLPVSTLTRLRALCDEGGVVAAHAALAQLALAVGFYAGPVIGEKRLPAAGLHLGPDRVTADLDRLPDRGDRPRALTLFYRAWEAAADTRPVDRLSELLQQAGWDSAAAFVPSLRDVGSRDWLASLLECWRPDVICCALAFSARDADGHTPLDRADCPVLQIPFVTNERALWQASSRGLSPSDLAMHVALPELDGRLSGPAVSFKGPLACAPELQFTRLANQADDAALARLITQANGWLALRRTAPVDRRCALVLSRYPGRDDLAAHAVGLDAPASAVAILTALAREAGLPDPALDGAALLRGLLDRDDRRRLGWPVAAYQAALASLPVESREELYRVWGRVEDDPLVGNGRFCFAAMAVGNHIVALQPERGRRDSRVGDYHDTSHVPCHGYVAFHLWLHEQTLSALIHIGAHGTLEWLPGKAAVLSDSCWPQLLTRGLPVLYPFIVNDPGEAVQAKRRLAAVTIGHVPPPLQQSQAPDHLAVLERLLDDYSTSDGLDGGRRDRLVRLIRDEAAARGLTASLGITERMNAAEALTRIDAFVCDVKDTRFTDGLHVFGQAAGEMAGLLRGLAGRHVPPGPSGSPYRGRHDVLPTGRNLHGLDPRAIPTRDARAQGVRMAEELLRRHLQDHGDWPQSVLVDLWGSASLRTAGEEFAMAMHLAGLSPLWDSASGRVTGFEILPLAMLDRPRIDVTLRMSGLFRDIFENLARLFAAACEALALRDEEPANNPYKLAGARIFAPEPGRYGVDFALDDLTLDQGADREKAAGAWLAASDWAVGSDGRSRHDPDGLRQRLEQGGVLVQARDMPESDVLMAWDHVARQAGAHAAMRWLTGRGPQHYQIDSSNPDQLRARPLAEEIARVVHGRITNPDWIAGLRRHGGRGAAELVMAVEHLSGFASLTDAVTSDLLDHVYRATLDDDDLTTWMAEVNEQALAALKARFQGLYDSGLWQTRHNSAIHRLAGAS